MEIIAWAAVLGCLPGAIAKSKGHSFWGFWIYGALLFPIALIHSIAMRAEKPPEAQFTMVATDGVRQCPFCAETIKAEAIVCRYCHRDLPPIVAHSEDLVA